MRTTTRFFTLGAAFAGSLVLATSAYAGDNYPRQSLRPQSLKQPVAGRAVTLPPSLTAGSCTEQQIMAVKHFDSANAALRSVQADLLALKDMSASKAAFGPRDALTIVSAMEADIQRAYDEVGALSPLATKEFAKASPTIKQTKDELKKLNGTVCDIRAAIAANDVTRVNDLSEAALRQLDDSWTSFSAVASTFDYRTSLRASYQASTKAKLRAF